jgi:hypothetical protein
MRILSPSPYRSFRYHIKEVSEWRFGMVSYVLDSKKIATRSDALIKNGLKIQD